MRWRAVIFTLSVVLASAPVAASTFALETSAFLNGGLIPSTDAANADSCGGRNISPPLLLSGAPANARSFAVVAFDPDAGGGHGFVHWVAYGITPSARPLRAGFGSQASAAFVGGLNDAGTKLYFGPCPLRGDPPHRYVFTAYALDLAPGRLRPGLTRPALLHAIAGHTLAQATITGRFGR
jgi:Raf kinase inhibitor-like YbhB/YbcL family protein